ncbi:unnamed protein product [Leptidea sinapis]|uniref:Uncharacterized protein n=1 Tax=Leptidea sinapis TaxID=189913 RepID=A0A5E4PP89_9NEOP|nr:unnamed protein product [Leptidea sinapis]
MPTDPLANLMDFTDVLSSHSMAVTRWSLRRNTQLAYCPTSLVCAELLSTLFSLGGLLFFLRELADRGLFCELVGAVPAAWAAASAGLMRGFRVDVPFE